MITFRCQWLEILLDLVLHPNNCSLMPPGQMLFVRDYGYLGFICSRGRFGTIEARLTSSLWVDPLRSASCV